MYLPHNGRNKITKCGVEPSYTPFSAVFDPLQNLNWTYEVKCLFRFLFYSYSVDKTYKTKGSNQHKFDFMTSLKWLLIRWFGAIFNEKYKSVKVWSAITSQCKWIWFFPSDSLFVNQKRTYKPNFSQIHEVWQNDVTRGQCLNDAFFG